MSATCFCNMLQTAPGNCGLGKMHELIEEVLLALHMSSEHELPSFALSSFSSLLPGQGSPCLPKRLPQQHSSRAQTTRSHKWPSTGDYGHRKPCITVCGMCSTVLPAALVLKPASVELAAMRVKIAPLASTLFYSNIPTEVYFLHRDSKVIQSGRDAGSRTDRTWFRSRACDHNS